MKHYITYRGITIQIPENFPPEIIEIRRQRNNIFIVLGGKLFKNNLPTQILYPVTIYFRNEGKIKSFSNEGKLKEFVTVRPALQEMLKEVFQAEGK